MTNLMTIVALHVLVASGVFPMQKPVVDSPIIGDIYNPPPTLQSMVDRSDAVVIGTIRSTRETPNIAKRIPRTDYDLTVTETVKEHTRLAPKLVLCRPGIGTVEHEDRFVRKYQPGMPEIKAGRDYLLFLLWDDANTCYTLAFGTGSIAGFNEEGKLAHLAASTGLNDMRGLAAADVVAKLERARTRR